MRRTGGGCWLAVALAGCAGTPKQPEDVSTGLSHMTGPDAPLIGGPTAMPDETPPPNSLAAAAAHNAALDLLAWQDQKERRAQADSAAPEPSPKSSQDVKVALEQPPTAPAPSDLTVGPPEPAESGLDEQITAAATTLEQLLRQRSTLAADRFRASLELAALEPLSPGLADGLAQSTDLSPAERATLTAYGDLATALAMPGVGGDPAKAADAFQEALDGLAGSLPVRIRAAELCTRVDGFGQYAPVEGNVFEAMRPHRVIIYTEVERFAYRLIGEAELGSHRAGPGDRWAVNLTQQLELYNETGAMSAWSRPALPVVETSRNKRRDFHIVDQIDLPSNLSIGIYHLKITVKDRATGAQDTRSVELRIVADPTLARGGR